MNSFSEDGAWRLQDDPCRSSVQLLTHRLGSSLDKPLKGIGWVVEAVGRLAWRWHHWLRPDLLFELVQAKRRFGRDRPPQNRRHFLHPPFQALGNQQPP